MNVTKSLSFYMHIVNVSISLWCQDFSRADIQWLFDPVNKNIDRKGSDMLAKGDGYVVCCYWVRLLGDIFIFH